ncbi:putative heavy metal-associated domain, HMA, heavy metal-associated domain superfamily [Helianthus annuus]|uniref:uncharacterized protein LOC118480478 n=1 Tax=Helianthus annuus TaxID=4232 RepID=UPI001652DB92|nr:uncharacterized protein LOC118480478 [Helianthus annuus]KAJ0909256.1 putative heavy metal-associated domain, HMA, heavy metal-associated domain superfamily [Helianthus annuus]
MTMNLQILGFHNCNGCARKVETALSRIGVRLVELDRESGNVTVASAENPEVIRRALERKLNKSVVVLSRDLVPINQNPNPVVAYQVPANRALDLQQLGHVMVTLAEVLDGVEITRSNTTTINFIHRQTPPVVRRNGDGYNGVRIREIRDGDVDQYASPRPPPRTPPWTPIEPSAPLMPATEQVVYGYPPGYYGVSTCHHDHSNGCCNIM